MASSRKKHPDDRLGRLNAGDWFSRCIVPAIIFIILTLLVFSFLNSATFRSQHGGDGPIWEWDWAAFQEITQNSEKTANTVYRVIVGVYAVFILIGLFIMGMQSDHYLCLDKDGLVGKGLGKRFNVSYKNIRCVIVKEAGDLNFILRGIGSFIPPIGCRSTLIIHHSGGKATFIYEKNAAAIAREIEKKMKEMDT